MDTGVDLAAQDLLRALDRQRGDLLAQGLAGLGRFLRGLGVAGVRPGELLSGSAELLTPGGTSALLGEYTGGTTLPYADVPSERLRGGRLRAALQSFTYDDRTKAGSSRSLSRFLTGDGDLRLPAPLGEPELMRVSAFERYLDGGGVLSASVFHRRIEDLIRNQTRLETVSWSSAPRYVSRPQNVGKASTQGIELEAKFRLDEVIAEAAPIDLRTSGAVFRSSVDGIDGPDNRLDQQPGWTAGLGADWRLRGIPLTVGGNLALTPAYAVRQSATQRSTTDARRVLDAYALWRFSPVAQLRLAASNLLARDETGTTSLATLDGSDTLTSTTTTFEPSQTSWSLRLELKL